MIGTVGLRVMLQRLGRAAGGHGMVNHATVVASWRVIVYRRSSAADRCSNRAPHQVTRARETATQMGRLAGGVRRSR